MEGITNLQVFINPPPGCQHKILICEMHLLLSGHIRSQNHHEILYTVTPLPMPQLSADGLPIGDLSPFKSKSDILYKSPTVIHTFLRHRRYSRGALHRLRHHRRLFRV
jgi:hypothetical protein